MSYDRTNRAKYYANLPDEAIEREDRAHLIAANKCNKAFHVALGLEWACGHHRNIYTTHVIGGVAQCKPCRRLRWRKGVARVLRARRAAELIAAGKTAPVAQTNYREIERLVIRPGNGRYPLDVIQAGVCKQFGIRVQDLLGPNRKGHLVRARAVVARILRDRNLSYPTIGHLLGGRDHSSIINLGRKFDLYCRDPRVVLAYETYRDSEA